MLAQVKDWLSGVFDSAFRKGPPPYDTDRVIFAGEDKDAEGTNFYSFSFYQVEGPYSFKARLLSGTAHDLEIIATLRNLKPGYTMRIIEGDEPGHWNTHAVGIEDISADLEYDIPNAHYPPPTLNLDLARRSTAGHHAVQRRTESPLIIK